MKRKSKWPLLLGLAGILTFLGEILLRQNQFHYETSLEFGYPRPADFLYLRYDPDVFWTLPPRYAGVNSWGFPGGEFVIPKPEGIYRILFLGDSIMQAGYPSLAATCLRQISPHVESVSLALNGYSSYQGRVLAEKYGLLLEPDLVLVQFGWNDHWLAYGEPDAEKALSPAIRWQAPFNALFDRIRVLQLLAWVGHQLVGAPDPQTGELRVPPIQYRTNLTAIRRLFEARGIPVVFVTAPSGFKKLGVPDDVITRRFAASTESAHQLHHQYNDIVREVAGQTIDLEQQFEELIEQELTTLFETDHIHPTTTGSQEIANRVCEVVAGYLK